MCREAGQCPAHNEGSCFCPSGACLPWYSHPGLSHRSRPLTSAGLFLTSDFGLKWESATRALIYINSQQNENCKDLLRVITGGNLIIASSLPSIGWMHNCYHWGILNPRVCSASTQEVALNNNPPGVCVCVCACLSSEWLNPDNLFYLKISPDQRRAKGKTGDDL